ncbi:hypothetical protein IGI37_003730 [Enterococcus sp. AZ194]|uniref:ParA family protein n=1 Tax=Enterococcus sp. AZ194 TaxID=2774629 RepID=UPI003F23A6C6
MDSQSIVTLVARKGGVGKTLLLYEFSNFLANFENLYTGILKEYFTKKPLVLKNSKILLIDMDEQKNISQYFDHYEEEEEEGTVLGIFLPEAKDPELIPVAKNIDLIPGDSRMATVGDTIATHNDKNFKILKWYRNHAESLNLSAYDYIFFDFNSGTGTAQQNSMIVANFILTLMEPDKSSFTGKVQLEERIDNIRQTLTDPMDDSVSYVTAELITLANKIENNTDLSKQLKAFAEESEDILGWMPKRQQLPNDVLRGKSMFDTEVMQERLKKQSDREFYKHVVNLFTKLKNKMDE